MKKIMFYINVINGGGAERVMVNLASQFAESGYEAIFVTSYRAEGEYLLSKRVKRLSLEDAEIKQSRIKRNFTRIRKLRRICKKEKPEALITFMAEPNFRAIIATIGLPVKTIISVRNDPNREYAGKLGRAVGRYILPRASGCVFQTQEAREWFPARLQKKSEIIYNEVAESFFSVQRENCKNVVSLGRLCGQKNHRLMISAFAAVADKYPHENLLIYGAGELERELQKLIVSLNLCDRVKLMGLTSRPEEVLATAAVFVLSSDYEGMPNALMEALAAGVPCIATDCPCGGPGMLIENGKNGVLVPVGDREKLVKALDRLLSDSQYAKMLGENARKEAGKYYPETVFRHWKSYVKRVTEG